MKFPIKWHEECLINHRATVLKEIKAFQQLQERIARMQKDLAFHELQIETAKKEGKNAYDAELYLKKRGEHK